MEINPSSIVTPDDPVNSYYCNHIYYPYYYQNTYGEMQCLRSFCDTSVVWYGEDFYNFCFLATVTKSINVVEGSEYVQIYLGYVPSTSETGSCFDCTEYFVTTDNLFLQPDGECTYLKFNETKPTDTAFVKIIVTDYSDEVYTFNVFVVNPVFTLFDYTYDHNLKRNNEIRLDVCASPQFGYSLNLPDTTKYNVEIIMGYDFGNLVNNTTSDSGQVLNDLPHNYGCLDQIILRTNDQIQADSEIKIRVSTSDPSIEPIEMTFTNLLVVNIVPETIAPGDTAQIIPKMKNPDGSLSDFPIEQTFEIGMLDGCALGIIKTATDSGVYVDAALQPFYFIADTGAVEGNVKLRVGVIEGMSSSSLLNNNFKSRKHENQIKKSSASDNHIEAQSFIDGGVIGEYCFLGDLYSVVTGDANLVVGNECGSGAPLCSTIVQAPLGFKEEVVEWTGTYIFNKEGYYPLSLEKASGGEIFFLQEGQIKMIPLTAPSKDKIYEIPILGSFYSPYEIETCFNKNLNNGKGAYQYSFKSIGETDNFIHKPIIIQVADYTDDPYNMKSLNDLETIPFEKICSALIDFEYERYRKAEQSNDNFINTHPTIYSILDVYWEHEKYHKRDGMRFMNDKYSKALLRITKPDGYFISKTLKKHLETTFSCSQQIKNFSDAQREGEKYIEDALREFDYYFKDNWYIIKIDIYQGGQWKQYRLEELWAQWSDSVQNKITKYQNELSSRPGYDPSPCEDELKEIRKFWDPFNIYRNNR